MTRLDSDMPQMPLPPNKRGLRAAVNQRFGRKAWVIAALALLIGVVGVMSGAVYAAPNSGFSRQLARVLPYPAVVVNADVLTLREYHVERDALSGYFATLGQDAALPAEAQLESGVVDTLVNRTLLEQLAEQRGVEVKEEEIDELFAESVGGAQAADAFAKQIQDTFGWTQEEFKERVISSIALATNMSESVASDPQLQDEAREEAEAALVRLEQGEEFGTVAKEVNSDHTSTLSGDLGLVSPLVMPPEWREAIGQAEEGERTGIIETNDGFAILRVEERVDAGQGGQVRLSAVLVPKRTLDDVIRAYQEESEVWWLIGKPQEA